MIRFISRWKSSTNFLWAAKSLVLDEELDAHRSFSGGKIMADAFMCCAKFFSRYE